MRIDLLLVPNCPHAGQARATLTAAIAEAGISTQPIVTTVISDDEQAQLWGFTGSPTILLNGVDPFADPDAPIGIACRIYRTATGVSGIPDQNTLREALLREVERPTGG